MQEGEGKTGMISVILAKYAGGGRGNRCDISNTNSVCRRGRENRYDALRRPAADTHCLLSGTHMSWPHIQSVARKVVKSLIILMSANICIKHHYHWIMDNQLFCFSKKPELQVCWIFHICSMQWVFLPGKKTFSSQLTNVSYWGSVSSSPCARCIIIQG